MTRGRAPWCLQSSGTLAHHREAMCSGLHIVKMELHTLTLTRKILDVYTYKGDGEAPWRTK